MVAQNFEIILFVACIMAIPFAMGFGAGVFFAVYPEGRYKLERQRNRIAAVWMMVGSIATYPMVTGLVLAVMFTIKPV